MTTEMIGFATMGTSLVAIVAFTLKNAYSESVKRARIYSRLDEERDDAEKTYVRKDVHKVKYDSLESMVKEMRGDIKKLLNKSGINE